MNCVIFGGGGFIGQHFARFLLEGGFADKVWLADIERPVGVILGDLYQRCIYVEQDVRRPIVPQALPKRCDLICNFAACGAGQEHTEAEHYEVNLRGAEHICAWARTVDCNQILFTSSVAVYGEGDSQKQETSPPAPDSAFGGAKLLAEKVYEIWRLKNPKNRKLIIVRLGDVFGPHQDGHMNDLIRRVLGRRMFYAGDQEVYRATIYVRELCRLLWWTVARNRAVEPHIVLNAAMTSAPSVQDCVETICETADIERRVPSLPLGLATVMGQAVDVTSRLARRELAGGPAFKRQVISTDIKPAYLVKNHYKFKYSLAQAFKDWKAMAPEDWGR